MRNIIFSIGIASVFLVSCGGNKNEIHPELQDITETVFASGSLDADDRYNLIAQTEGYITDFKVEEGDLLDAGNVVAIVQNTSFESNEKSAADQYAIAKYNTTNEAPAIKEAIQNLEMAEVKMDQDEKNFQRYKNLFEKNSISKLDFENATLTLEQSKTNVVNAKERLEQVRQQARLNEIAAKSQFEIAQSNGAFNSVSAIEGGVLVKKMKQKGDFVRKGDVIGIVANLNSIKAYLNVDENSIGKLKLHQNVDIRLNTIKDIVLKATITEVRPMFDEATQSFICEASFTDSLRFNIIGTQLEANIIIGTKKNVLLIPREYLSFSNTVQVKGEDQVREVKTGIKSSKWVEILGGVTKDDVLVPLKK